MASNHRDVSSQRRNEMPSAPVTVSQPKSDPCFTRNLRVIEDLLYDEKRYHSTPGYCSRQTSARTIWMRRALLNWLREICIYRGTDGEVLAHTAQLIDRYMHVFPTDQSEYQLIGSTCFFISSKLKETIPISLSHMAEYSAHSATEQDILAKELTICISLQWDLTCITPVDFIAPVVDFLEFVSNLRQIIRQAALCIYIKAFHVEELSVYMPSYTAAACILYALNLTVHPDLSDVALRSVTRIQHLLRLEARKLREVYQTLQACFEPGTVQLSSSVREGDMGPIESPPRELNTSLIQSVSVCQPTSNVNSVSSHLTSYTSDILDQSLLTSGDLSSTSTGLVSNNNSFDRNYAPVASNSACSTSSPPSETELLSVNDSENDKSHSTRLSQIVTTVHQSQMLTNTYNYPNGEAAGQNFIIIDEHKTIQPSIWKNTGPLTNATDVALKAVLMPTDPRLLLLASTGLPAETERRWTPTDVREVLLD